jgi:hypothetical protein
MFPIGFGKFNSRFYWLILFSALMKLLINISFKLQFQDYKSIQYVSILNKPVLNDHIFIRFIYYYLGFIFLGILFQKIKISKQKNEINYKKEIKTINPDESINSDSETRTPSKNENQLIHRNYLMEISQKSFRPLFYAAILYIAYEMIMFYFNQNNHEGVNFWVLEIFFIHFLLFKKEKFKLYKHQILSFSIIIIFSFGIKFISSFLKQCEYPTKTLEEAEEKFKEMAENMHMTPEMFEMIYPQIKDMIINTAMESYRNGEKACKNMYNVLLLEDYFEYFIILSALGYLLGLFLHSFSAIKFKYFIDKKYISPYLIIIFIGLIGLVLNIILLFISSFINCGHSNYSLNFCHAMEYEEIYNNTTGALEELEKNYYFDNFLAYKDRLNDAFHPHNGTNNNKTYIYSDKVRNSKDGILEIIFSLTILPIFGFFKTVFDLFIIKELGVFHLLFPEVIYQFAKDLIIIIYKEDKGMSDKTQIKQFIFIGIADFFAIIGFSIYLELIELKFCKFDYYIKENMILRSMLEIDDANNDMRVSDINDEENSDSENNDEDKY